MGKVPVNLGVSDSFTRPNSTSSLGSTDGALSGDPQAWTASIEVRRNGTVAYAASSTQFQTATKQALACFGPNNQWDDFSVAPA